MKRRGSTTKNGHPALWATLTIIAFPLTAMALEWMGVDPIRSFAGGAAASLLILLLEGAVRGRWWISEPAISRVLEDPELGWRLLVLTGIILLIFQSVTLVGFLTNRSLDGGIVRFILSRQCANPANDFIARLCQTSATDSRLDAATMAMRDAAENRLLSGGFVTCAVRPLASQFTPDACVHGALVRCDRWVMGTVTRIPVSVESAERTVVAAMRVMSDGTYRIDGWSDDPVSTEWETIGGEVAQQASAKAAAAMEQKRGDMQAETFRRALQQLQAR